MTAFDLSTPTFIDFMATQWPPGAYLAKLNSLDVELKEIMENNNFTEFDQLLYKIAIE